MRTPLRVAIITNIIPAYRKDFFDIIFNNDDFTIKVFCQSHLKSERIRVVHELFVKNVCLVKGVGLPQNIITFQFIPFLRITKKYDVIVISGNIRNISDFLLSALCKILNKKVVIWTSAHSYRDNKWGEYIRLTWTKFFKYIFLYNDLEVEYLRKKGFNKHYLLGMNNGLNQIKIDKSIKIAKKKPLSVELNPDNFSELSNRKVIISCARLELKNRFDLLVDSLHLIKLQIPNILWIVIGTGSQEAFLKKKLSDLGLERNAYFVGELFDEYAMAEYFLLSQVFVHPSAIGLSIFHGFGFGLPVVVHGENSKHGPEYSAFESGVTGLNFQKDNYVDLAEKILFLLKNPELSKNMGKAGQNLVREKYNVNVMAERFFEIVSYSFLH